MDPSFFKQADEDEELHELAQDYFAQGNHIKALEVIEDAISTRGKDKLPGMIPFLQGSILYELATRAENTDLNLKFAFCLSSVEAFEEDCGMHSFAATALFDMAKQLDSALYYKKAVKIAKQTLSLLTSFAQYIQLSTVEVGTKIALENIIKASELQLLLGCTGKKSEPTVGESKQVPGKIRTNTNDAAGKRLRSYWASMNVESKRNFAKVSIAKLRSYVERLYGKEGKDALEEVLDSARINKKWKFWMCRTCSQKFFYVKKFKNHLEQEHGAKFKPSTTKHMPQRVDEVWARRISVAGWEPVDAVAAAEMIKTRLEFVKEFVKNGWSKDWPLAADEERSKLLKEIQLLLVSLWERKVLSCSIRDWMMHFPIKHLAQFEVTEHTLTTECRLVETPQSICFLDSHELKQILDFLKRIKCERDDGTDLVCRAVGRLWDRTRVKEKIEFDGQFSFMLLDKRLLRGEIASFDDEGTIDVCDDDYYAKTHPQGDDIVTWLLDYPLIDGSFEFPRSVRAHNLDIWVAVLGAIHYTCRSLGTKYAKKLEILSYDRALIDAKNLCMSEDERRRNAPKDKWNMYASLLSDKCEERLTLGSEDSPNAIQFLGAVGDILKGESHPTFNFEDLEDRRNLIHGLKNVSDDVVLNSIDRLKSVVTNKVPLLDSNILLVETSRISLLNELTRLSVFDYRSYILNLLKRFMREDLDGIVSMDAKSKVAAAEADLLSGEKREKENKSGSKKKKRRSIKVTSTSMSTNLGQNVEHESAVNHEPGATSPSLKSAEEDRKEPEVTLSSERGRLDISPNTDNQEEAAKDMQNMPGEDLLSKDMESPHCAAATRCNLALDMTLKALCKIKVLKEYLVHNRHQFPDNQEGKVRCALQDFLTAFVSKQIKDWGLYTYLLGNVLKSLEEVHLMSSDAAELLVSILEFWPCWKTPDIESFVTHLFTLEEYERMSCSNCRKNPNYPEQSSYGVVMAADSIRDLKCAFGNMKLEDILRVIRMEDKMLCDIKTGGCGKANFVHHIISRFPFIFTIVLIWEKNETDKEIYETTKALDWKIDISRLYEGLEPKTEYRLVSMVGRGEEEEYICLAYKKNRWVSFRHKALAKKAVGTWQKVVRFCEEMKVRPEILFYEAVQ